MLSDSYDVVIVGAGPAGCAAALSLPPGARVLLIDRARHDSARCCGGLLTTDALRALAVLRLALPESVRVRPEPRSVHAYDLDSGREQTYRRRYLNLDRALFDAWLLRLAGERVEVSPETRFAALGPLPGDIILRQAGSTQVVHAGTLIGADGANSTVRRLCLPRHPGPTTMVALQAALAYRGPSGDATQTHEVLFGQALTDYYAWAIPKGDRLLIGCAFERTEGAKTRFEQVLAWYRERLDLGAEVLERSARRLSRPRARRELFGGSGRVLLAGEAAGLVSPSSGEGISYALLSGAAAGRAAGAAMPAATYQREFDRFAREVMAKRAKAKVIYSPRLRAVALRLPWYP